MSVVIFANYEQYSTTALFRMKHKSHIEMANKTRVD
jgi:hypothetical protein